MCIRDRCGLMGGFAYVILARYGHDMIPEALLLGTWVGIMARVVSFNHFVVLPIFRSEGSAHSFPPVSYTHLRAHETPEHLVCRLLLEKKKKKIVIPYSSINKKTVRIYKND
eukprot:TRINITY_DN3220_c0_g1_i2.p1 TRINITY_DN3220_c0_g1~~TRINITY_DN3220_c0_g1_i2.p1  ORF type:complete len:112 (+),score=31.12 TRINITY_DN3220_c0_g1_i2:124-459(+)